LGARGSGASSEKRVARRGKREDEGIAATAFAKATSVKKERKERKKQKKFE